MADSEKTGAEESMVLSVTGMSCDGCARAIERVLSRIPGVLSAQVDFGRGVATVTGRAAPSALVEAVTAAGYGASLGGATGRCGGRHERG